MCSSERFRWFWHRKLTLKVKFWYFLTAPHYTNFQNLVISFEYSWFLAKNLSNFVSLPWKLHDRECHTIHTSKEARQKLFQILDTTKEESIGCFKHFFLIQNFGSYTCKELLKGFTSKMVFVCSLVGFFNCS